VNKIIDQSPTHAECFDSRGIYIGWMEWLPRLGGWNVQLAGLNRAVFPDRAAAQEWMERNGARTIKWSEE
jgi:hypothetical protein